MSAHASTSRRKVSPSGIRRSKHWAARAAHSISAIQTSAPPETLQTLVNFVTQSTWFSVHALACRALAFYDRWQEALNLAAHSNTSNHLTGMDLVRAEAKLEAGQINDEWWSVLSRPLAESCRPLTVALAETWRQLLSAEAHFAHGDDLSTVIPRY